MYLNLVRRTVMRRIRGGTCSRTRQIRYRGYRIVNYKPKSGVMSMNASTAGSTSDRTLEGP